MLNHHSNIYIIHKPKGITSNEVIQTIKKHCQIKKIGHGGTLDPLASGVLVIGINRGTKQLGFHLDATKQYEVTMEFGYQTDTYDTDGKVVNKINMPVINTKQIAIICQQMQQHYEQTVPNYSAVKYQGQALYKYAREGINVPEIKKTVHIFDYEIISLINNILVMRLTVSKGFYIRSFCNDLGIALNGYATMTGLCRLRSGEYLLENALTISDFISLYNSKHKTNN